MSSLLTLKLYSILKTFSLHVILAFHSIVYVYIRILVFNPILGNKSL